LLVTIIRNSKTAGFFQLASNRADFSDQDLQSIVRLAEMVSTAMNCMDAEAESMAEHSAPAIPMAVAPSPKPASPVLWHAPAGVTADSFSKGLAASDMAVSVYACESCGFPVSRGRKICFDCEDRGASPAQMARIFSEREKQEESWLSVHGYTIASLLVTALVAAIIYWLH
jgi:hypothetical protein